MFRVVIMVVVVLCLLAGGSYVVLNKDSSWGQKFQHTLMAQQVNQALNDKDWGQAQHVLETLHQAQPLNPDVARQLAQVYTHQAIALKEQHPDDALKSIRKQTIYIRTH